ncbi:MAG: hypothetical protein NC120_04240 [Ruminococcus sp.]|nr:hypothetical protein [Ruminococcus sp.]
MTELTDGGYTVEVSLSGGSGRAGISSPAELEVSGGEMTARIEWSSPYYDYMEMGGGEYYPVSTESGSVFLVDVPCFDRDIPVLARTTAMSVPHTVEYSLRFDSNSVKADGDTAAAVFTGAGMLIAVFALIFGKRKCNEKK